MAGDGKDFTRKTRAFISLWNLEQQTTDNSILQVLAKGEAIQAPILGMSDPEAFSGFSAL
jgi:hypothetical protein